MEVHDIADLAGRIGRGLMEQVFKTCRVAIASASMKKDWHKAESAARGITQQTAAAVVGASDSRISDYLNKKDYEDNAWVLAARFWQGLCADLQQLSIVAEIIRMKLHHKLATIDKMDALSLYTQFCRTSLRNSAESTESESQRSRQVLGREVWYNMRIKGKDQ